MNINPELSQIISELQRARAERNKHFLNLENYLASIAEIPINHHHHPNNNNNTTSINTITGITSNLTTINNNTSNSTI